MVLGALVACSCMQGVWLDVSLACARVWPADVNDGVVPENASTSIDDDVALHSAAVAVGAVIVLWDVVV